MCPPCCFFFFNDPATTEIYTLSLHDALPISSFARRRRWRHRRGRCRPRAARLHDPPSRSEEHTSELQSRRDLVCRLLLEKKKKQLTPRRLNPCKTSVTPLRTCVPISKPVHRL